LFKLSNVCAVYCRYCFRREMIGPAAGILNEQERNAALNYIRQHPEIWEVILTGGDPMILSPRRIAEVFDELSNIDHVQILRIHTRLPVVDPGKITPDLCAALARSKPVYIVIHINHTQ